jgi:hypothetical protein
MKTNIPDQVVFNQVSQKYDANIKEYGTNLGAPAIETVDTVAWKNKNVKTVNAHFNAKYMELKEALTKFTEEFEYNNMVYGSKFNFEPIVGETYHMYKDSKKEYFLSIIKPNECNFEFFASFYLSDDKLWKKIE